MSIPSGDIRDQFESCQKSRWILDVLLPSHILLGAPLPKLVFTAAMSS